MKTWLVLDCHFLCYRAWHINKELSHKGKATGVIYGFLRSISQLKDEFGTDRVAFCFEHHHLYRRDIYPNYKLKRRRAVDLDPEEAQALQTFKAQIKQLRREYLPRIGFRNVFRKYGMESDDLMAAIAASMLDDEEVILVTADSDMWQCLGPKCRIYNPTKRQILTEQAFTKQHGIIPAQWSMVKAIAGCAGDNVEGIPGVGEITALKYVRDEMKLDSSSPIYQKIRPHWSTIVVRNRKLVTLPFAGCPTPKLQEDELDSSGWREVCDELGMRSIRSAPPVATRKLHACV